MTSAKGLAAHRDPATHRVASSNAISDGGSVRAPRLQRDPRARFRESLAAHPQGTDPEAAPGARWQRAGVDAWVVICRENDNDPLAAHVGGENAGGTAAFLFFRKDGRVRSAAISPSGEATALKDVGVVDEVRRASIAARTSVAGSPPRSSAQGRIRQRIAVELRRRPRLADGLSWTQRERAREGASAPSWPGAWSPSEDLVVRVAVGEAAGGGGDHAARRGAHGRAPGERPTAPSFPARRATRTSRASSRSACAELGVEDGWAPDQNPNVNSGPDRGHSHATDSRHPAGRLHPDGLRHQGRRRAGCTDIQRFAYVLAPGRDAAARGRRSRSGRRRSSGSRVALAAMKPGACAATTSTRPSAPG